MLSSCLQEMSQHAVVLEHKNASDFHTARNMQMYCISDRTQKSVGFRDILNIVRDEGLFESYTRKIAHNPNMQTAKM